MIAERTTISPHEVSFVLAELQKVVIALNKVIRNYVTD